MGSEKVRAWSSRYRDDFKAAKDDCQMPVVKRFGVHLDGEYLVEYGLLIALLVLVAGAILTVFNTDASTAFTALGTDAATQVK